MPRLGGALALLAGGLGGLGDQAGVERERTRAAALDDERRKELLFGRQLQSAQATMAAREKGYVPQVSDATKGLSLLTGDTSNLPGALAGMGRVAAETRQQQRARGTMQVPQPDGSVADLTYDPQADQGYQGELREANRRNDERATERTTKLADEDREQARANKEKYGAVAHLFGAGKAGAYRDDVDYGAVGEGLSKREADARDARRAREVANIAAGGRSAAGSGVERRAAHALVNSAKGRERSARNAVTATNARRPRQSQYADPLTREADPAAFGDALTNWRADSTMQADALRDAGADVGEAEAALQELFGDAGPDAGGDPAARARAELEQEQADVNEAIQQHPTRRAQILALYQQRVGAINAKYGIR